MIPQRIARHIREVEANVDGGPNARGRVIEGSRRRSAQDYGFDPTGLKEAYIVPDGELRQHRERLERLVRTARYGFESPDEQIATLIFQMCSATRDWHELCQHDQARIGRIQM